RPAPGPGPGAVAAPPSVAAPVGNYSIMCQRFVGPGHERQARLAKDTYVQATGRDQFFVFHETDRSELLYGGYRTIDPANDPLESNRAEADRAWIRSIKNSQGQTAFARSLLVPLPSADPSSNPEWNLALLDRDKPREDPGRRYWSIVIAAYTADAGDRKQLAVDSVRDARAMGLEAYYWHGPSVSHVTIGAWPRHAIAEQESQEATSKSESAANSGEALIVSPAPLSDRQTKQLEARGKVFQPRIDIRDPELLRVWQKYSEYAVNGEQQINNVSDPATGKTTARPQQSFLVEIPETQRGGIVSGGPVTPEPTIDEPAPSLLNPTAPSAGRGLKRIGK
ncbi:MAG TPA: hypothetical protein VF624_08490, partial [Tepidisphaeraceae bacterium]